MRRTVVPALAVVASTVALASLLAVASAQQCDVPESTLTFSCGAACSTNEPCVRKAASSCDLECFAAPDVLFTFLIPYDSTVGDTTKTPSMNNSVLTKITKWTIPTATTDIIIRGGSSLTASTKGKVATVAFADDFLAGNDHVTLLRLANLDLATSIAALAPNFPPRIQQLWLQNTRLTAFPTEITAFKRVVTLVLANNNIAVVDQSHEISQLAALHLSSNKIATFTALYPKLTYLDLAYNNLTETPAVLAKYTQLNALHLSGNKISNFTTDHIAKSADTLQSLGLFSNNLETLDINIPNLTYLNLVGNSFQEIPSIVFSHTKLQALYLDHNKLLRNVSLTNAQANFIATLTNFTADNNTFSTNCDATQQTTIQNYRVCITGDAVDLSVIQGPRVSATTAPSKTTNSTTLTPSGSDVTTSAPRTDSDVSSGDSSSSSSSLSIVLGCIAAVFAVALLAGFAYTKKRREYANKALSSNSSDYTATTNPSKGTSSAVVALWNDADLLAVKVNSDDVDDIEKIGSGAFCDVWLVLYRRTQRIASKRLRDVTRSRTQGFIAEIKLVATLSHPCIVELIGAAWTKEVDLQALFEFMDGGDLRNYLATRPSDCGWTPEKLQIAINVIEALVYVHSFNPPLVHRDLKSRNILLSSSNNCDNNCSNCDNNKCNSNGLLRAKLTDFGVARFKSEVNTMTAGVGTGKWLAPEVISGANDYGSAADIFSFGVVLSELDTHALPYTNLRGTNGNVMVDVALLQLVASGELRPSFSSSCPSVIHELAERCLSLRPEDRPSAPELAYALRSYKKLLSVVYAQL